MAALFGEDSEEEFEGFTARDVENVNPMEESMIGDDNESDISISTVHSEDLSDLSDEDELEEDEEPEQTWNSDRDPVNVVEFTARSGPVSWIPEDGTAIDFFSLLFPEELFELMVMETNRYARQQIQTKPDTTWRETTIEEMKAFLGLHVLFGIKQLPSTRLYWSENALLGVPEVKKIMPRNRFDKLTEYFHLNDSTKSLPREDPAYDKLFKIRPLLDVVTVKCQSEYLPGRDVSVDEAMVKFKGRLGMKQYMPMKPTKRGIKVWECAESASSFVINMQVYTGKKQDGGTEHGLGYRVVRDLTQNITGKHHHVYCDNFFTSIDLAQDLLQDQTFTFVGQFVQTGKTSRRNWHPKTRP